MKMPYKWAWWTDGKNTKRVPLDHTPPNGWRRGLPLWASGKDGKRIWITNGSTSSQPDPAPPPAPPAPVVRKKPKVAAPVATARKIWITNGNINRQLDHALPVPVGWKVGSTARVSVAEMEESARAERRHRYWWKGADNKARCEATRARMAARMSAHADP